MSVRTESTKLSRALAIACALQLLASGLPSALGVAALGLWFSDHAHAVRTSPDGAHLDVVLSHDAGRDAHSHEAGEHLHSAEAGDHVVHLIADEARDARRIPLSPPTLRLAAAELAPARIAAPARPLPAQRAVPPLPRRSVVLLS